MIYIFNYNLNLAIQKLPFDIKKPTNLFYVITPIIVMLLCLNSGSQILL